MVEKYGWDQTPTPDLGLDITKAPEDIQKLYKWVIQKTYGQDVASAYAQGLVAAGIIAKNAEALSLFTSGRMDDLNTFVNDMLLEMTDKDIVSAPEIIQARGGKDTLSERLEISDSILDEVARNNAKIFAKTMDMVTDQTLKVGDFANVKGWHRPNDTKDIIYEIVDKLDTRYTDSIRNQAIGVELKSGHIAIPYIENYVPMTTNNQLNVSEMIDVARTYFHNRDKLVYDVRYAHSVFLKDNPGVSYEWKPVTPEGKHPLVCSDLTMLAIAGVPYENSRFVDPEGENQPQYDWNMNFLTKGRDGLTIPTGDEFNAHWMAKWAYQNGFFFTPNTDLSNIKRGDFVFFSQSVEDRGYQDEVYQFLNIYHVGIIDNVSQSGAINMIHSSLNQYGAVTIDDITTPSFKYLRDRLIGFVRFPLDTRKHRFRSEYLVTQGASVSAYTPKLKISDGHVHVTVDGTEIKDGLTVNTTAFIGLISVSKYRPNSTVYFWVGDLNGNMYRCHILPSGDIRLVINKQTTNSLKLYGSVSYPLTNIMDGFTTY